MRALLSSAIRRFRPLHRSRLKALAATIVVAAAASVATFGPLSGRAPSLAETEVPLAYGDTVVVWGPYVIDAAGWYGFTFPVDVDPTAQYLVKIENGNPDGSQRMEQGWMQFIGHGKIVTPEEIVAGGPGWTKHVLVSDTSWLSAEIDLPSNPKVTVTLVKVANPSAIFFRRQLVNLDSLADQGYRYDTLTVPSSVGAPFHVCGTNGNADGTARFGAVQVINNNQLVSELYESSRDVFGSLRPQRAMS